MVARRSYTMEFGDTAKNIISFGAHGRVMRKQAEFDDVRPKLEKALKDLDSVRTRTNSQTQSLVKTKQRSVETLRAISRIQPYRSA